MAINNHNNIAAKFGQLKQGIKNLAAIIEKEPIIVISHSGAVWISEKAKKKLSEKKINTSDLLGWLRIGVKHLTEASYCDLKTFMVQVPQNPQEAEVLIILRDKHGNESPTLTSMEKKVLKYLVKGLSNKDIALNLNIGSGTVNAHLDNVYRKLDVSNRAAAICTAIKLGIVVQIT